VSKSRTLISPSTKGTKNKKVVPEHPIAVHNPSAEDLDCRKLTTPTICVTAVETEDPQRGRVPQAAFHVQSRLHVPLFGREVYDTLVLVVGGTACHAGIFQYPCLVDRSHSTGPEGPGEEPDWRCRFSDNGQQRMPEAERCRFRYAPTAFWSNADLRRSNKQVEGYWRARIRASRLH
jgi:hypothetical protein